MVKKIEHIGIAVRSIEESSKVYETLFQTQFYKEEIVESEGVRTAFVKIGDAKIELLEATNTNSPIAKFLEKGKINLNWLRELYHNYPNKTEFFNSFFNKLAGNDQLKKQIINNKSNWAIRHSWKKDLAKFKKTRAKYILYP